jgi:hypothetical protein
MTDINKIENIVIENKKIQTQIKELDIFELKYFLENPRINYMMAKSINTATQDDIDKRLWSLESVKRLSEAIDKNGGLLEEIIVMNNEVVEGNSRLCAYRHLYKEAAENEKSKWRKIRAKVIMDNLTSKELFLLLGNLHISGKTEWDPFEVASYINKTINDDGLNIREVSKMLNMRESTIETKLKAYGLMKDKYLVSLPSTEIATDHLNKFSIFEEYYKIPELQKFKKEASEILDDDKFVNLVLEKKIKSAAFDVRSLSDVLKDKSARKVFFNSDSDKAMKEAKKVLYQDKPEVDNDVLKKIAEMTNFLEKVEIGKFKDSFKDNERACKIIRKFRSSVKDFCNEIGIDNQGGGSIKKLSRKLKIRYV